LVRDEKALPFDLLSAKGIGPLLTLLRRID
jgi:hypothetical protein